MTLSGARDGRGGTDVTYTITAVTQDEPVTGAGDRTTPDAMRVPGRPEQVSVRDEAGSKGNGRVYRIAYTVSAGAATCSGVERVAVPRRRGDVAVDDGDTASWDSFTGQAV